MILALVGVVVAEPHSVQSALAAGVVEPPEVQEQEERLLEVPVAAAVAELAAPHLMPARPVLEVVVGGAALEPEMAAMEVPLAAVVVVPLPTTRLQVVVEPAQGHHWRMLTVGRVALAILPTAGLERQGLD